MIAKAASGVLFCALLLGILILLPAATPDPQPRGERNPAPETEPDPTMAYVDFDDDDDDDLGDDDDDVGDDDDDDDGGEDGEEGGISDAEFVKLVTGTYLDNGIIGTGEFIGMQTLNADGTHYSINTKCCGSGDPTVTGPQSHGQGVWKRTGERQVTLTAIIFIFDTYGDLAIYAVPTLVADFSEDFETAEATITTPLILPAGDPLDPNEEPVAVAEGVDTWRRLHVMD